MSTSSASDQLDCVVDHGASEQRKSASSVRLVPRQRFENNGPVEVNLSILTATFHMRLPDAAKSLRISETSLKHVCRQLGVARWPHRMMLRAPPEEDCAGGVLQQQALAKAGMRQIPKMNRRRAPSPGIARQRKGQNMGHSTGRRTRDNRSSSSVLARAHNCTRRSQQPS